MTYILIDEAPFTFEEKWIIKYELGVVGADWGHPDVVLDDPVQFFRDWDAEDDDIPVADDRPEKTKYEINDPAFHPTREGWLKSWKILRRKYPR